MTKLETKFVIALIGVLCLTVLCGLGRLDGTQFLTGFGLVVGAFIVAKARQEELQAKLPSV